MADAQLSPWLLGTKLRCCILKIHCRLSIVMMNALDNQIESHWGNRSKRGPYCRGGQYETWRAKQQCTWDMTRGMQDFLSLIGGCMGVQVEGCLGAPCGGLAPHGLRIHHLPACISTFA